VLALKSFREHDCAPGPAAHLSVEVKSPSMTHTLVVHAVEDWLNGGAKSPKEAIEKRRLKELLSPWLVRVQIRQWEKIGASTLLTVTDLERSHSELRAALIIAGREIRRLNFGRRDNPVLNKMREVMRDARKVAAQERQKSPVRVKLTT
jgi:hypothetical protein